MPGKCEPAPFPHSGYPWVLGTREGIILHFATGESRWPADNGKTWNELTVGDKALGTYYYPKAIQMADGRIMCIGHLGSDDVYGTVDQCIKQQTFCLKVQDVRIQARK